jgi:hypothetical protein
VFGAGQPLNGGNTVLDHWAIEARWDGRGQRLSQDVEQHPEARTVVAFNAAGQVVAWWDGMHRSGGAYMTE